MAEIGVKDKDGLYGGEQLRQGGGPSQKPLNDSDCRELSNGSPHKFYKKKEIDTIVVAVLFGIVIGAMIFIISWFVGIMSGEYDKPRAGMAYVVRLATIILTSIGSVISFVIWIVRMKNRRGAPSNSARRGETEFANLIFGQSKYDPTAERQARRKILKIGLPVVFSLIGAFIVVLIVGRVIIPISKERKFLYLMLWFAPIAIVVVYANIALWLIYFMLFSPSWVAHLACPGCKYLNTVIYTGILSASTSKYDRKISSTKSHEYQTHTIYDSAGNKIGGVYGWTSGEDIYSYGTDTTTIHEWICAKCGYEFTSHTYSSHEEGQRHVPNGR